ncbi:MAG: hypothetical protein HUU57_14065 [Bdellovibrio sp.]|nr:hypothetical protein [Bdellovibrio sp.]
MKELSELCIKIHEPFAEFLLADQEEYKFSISALDVVRFAGHACPSMIGAFLISQRAVQELFPDTNTCVRGQVAIEIPTSVEEGATGPISNVFSMIFGAWEKSGFGGLQGKFVRRNLLKYSSPNIPRGVFRFHNLQTGTYVDLTYDHSKAEVSGAAEMPFQKFWRLKIETILQNPEKYIQVK